MNDVSFSEVDRVPIINLDLLNQDTDLCQRAVTSLWDTVSDTGLYSHVSDTSLPSHVHTSPSQSDQTCDSQCDDDKDQETDTSYQERCPKTR